MIYDVIVIGAGVIGGMIAREMTKFNQTVCILERESDVACGASKANSGIVHGGYDPEPETLKAKLNSRGVDLLYDAARELCVPVQKNGSMVCAFGPEEDAIIQQLYNRGVSNHVSDMEILTGDAARELEPELSTKVTSVLRVKNAGIICPYELTIAAIGNAMDNGATLKLQFSVADITYADGRYLIWSDKGDLVEGKLLINCAGGCADKIAAMIGDHSFKIIPRAGEYLLLDKDEGKRVRHTIFRTPSAQGKGILVTPTVDGNLLVGPTAEVVEQPCSTRTTQQGLDNVRTSASDIVPNIDYRNVITSFTGVRASEKRGDFLIEFSSASDRFINVAAIDSPGLTCSAAIAEYVKQLLDDAGLLPGPNIRYIPFREDPHSFRNMSDEEKNVYIQLRPSYGKIICRCEGISEGEIIRALQQNPPATDVDGVKRRTRPGMGRCQGGFCTPYVMKLIAQEREIPKEQVTKKGRGSEMVAGKRYVEHMIQCDIAVVGGGPAGMAAAVAAYDCGVKNVIILDREEQLGGILRQCIHNGFGLHKLGQELTGPEYAACYQKMIEERGIRAYYETTVIKLSCDKVLTIQSRNGIQKIQAKAVILAMGCRERSRGALSICGSRPAGIYSAGTAQKLINCEGYLIGKRAVILGSGDIGLIMARRLTLEGIKVEAVCELMPYSGGLTRNIVQCLEDFNIPLYLSTTVIEIHGNTRVEGVTIAQVDENHNVIEKSKRYIPCDTLLLSVGLIPENELTGEAGIEISSLTNGAVVDEHRQTDIAGIFSCGNVLHVHDLVDYVSDEAELAGRGAARFVLEGLADGDVVPVAAGEGVRYVLPQRVHIESGEDIALYMRVKAPTRKTRITVRSGTEELAVVSRPKTAPGEMERIVIPGEKLKRCAERITVDLEEYV